MNKIKETLFDSLMIADSERIHTQVLAWVLSLDDKKFPNKSGIFEALFGLENFNLENLYVGTEINKIDLFIDSAGEQIIIENKLKSSEHSNQTDKYINEIPERFNNSEKRRHFFFLSLIKEEPKNVSWKSISFEELKSSLNKMNWPDGEKETVFIKEYIQSLGNLTEAFNSFIEDPKKIENVFTDGSKRKHEKFPFDDPIKDYIRKNQLETIFQKAYLLNLASGMSLDNFTIEESRGNASLNVFINEIKFDADIFHLNFQYQNNSMKIILSHSDYKNSKREQLTSNIISVFKEIFYEKKDYSRLNLGRSKAYISVSKKIPIEIEKMEKSELSSILKEEINYVKRKMREFKNGL